MKMVAAMVTGVVLALFGGAYIGYRAVDAAYRRWVNIHN